MKRKAVSLLLAGVMILGTSVTAMASTANNDPAKADKDLDGQGYIAAEDEYTENNEDKNGSGTDGMIDVTIPANDFLWYANEDTAVDGSGNYREDALFDDQAIAYYEIRSAKYEIKNNSEDLELQVSLLSYEEATFTGARNDIDASKVTLGLAGDLYVAGETEDLLNTPVSDIIYPAQLETESSWEYSFYGSYNDTVLPGAAEITDYVMVLEFEVTGA